MSLCSLSGIFRVLKQSAVQPALISMTRKMSTLENYKYNTLLVTKPSDFVYQVELNRPEKRNAMNRIFWKEFRECFGVLATDPECRVVILSGAGKAFTSGLDLMDHAELLSRDDDVDVGRTAFTVRNSVMEMQKTFLNIENCPKPVIAAVHGACVGAGIDMISACDMRYCTSDAWFQIKEVDIGLAADVGTLQWMPKIVGSHSWVRELALTARQFFPEEAKEFGFVSRIFAEKEEMLKEALTVAETVASKSPVAVQGTKINMNYSRDRTVKEGLDSMASWSSAMLQSEDVQKSAIAALQKEKAVFSKL
ncbi:delta(3,5)-Delta(2,4)-dienoyl-CoA isomerase, mitochondrial-like [Anneissia japonica]|uniref:delta(3,5)-Delta(2,4)-dienoyl-CoA isomerase, mitochondrial-like n=1 Tax=Anneissia japonica TaxID=1529436 RepID=UPI0014255064|nr:delta(3,5)-Delta(2,4)-dienoyl-CoA isomerase, mitochondrial-like [Anneissia japonica]